MLPPAHSGLTLQVPAPASPDYIHLIVSGEKYLYGTLAENIREDPAQSKDPDFICISGLGGGGKAMKENL